MAKRNKDFAKLLKALESAGYDVRDGKRHVQVRHPSKPGMVTMSSSSSDSHAHKNALGDLKRTFDYGR